MFRLYTRFIIIKSPGWDDLFIVLALLSSTTGSIIYCIRSLDLPSKYFTDRFDALAVPNYGLGASHMSTMTTEEVNAFLKVGICCDSPNPK